MATRRGAKKASPDPIPVEATVHDDSRLNIPTAQLRDLATVPDAAPLRYPRATELDPQLVWRGKDAEDDAPLAVPAPPVYIQEKVDPRAIVENLRRTAAEGEQEPELALFDDFDRVHGLDVLDFYEHENNWSNRLILGDALETMTSLAEREQLRGRVQMVYLDPPYGISFRSNWQVSTSSRDVQDGRDVTREPEVIKAFRDTWKDGIHTYLGYLRDRLTVARDLLTESGSIFVQISDTNVHLVRSLLDEVFGAANFVSQISFQTTSGFETNTIATLGDYLLWYARDASRVKVRKLYEPQPVVPGEGNATWLLFPDGAYRGVKKAERLETDRLPKRARLYKPDNLQSQGAAKSAQKFRYGGKTYSPNSNNHWKASFPEGMERLAAAGRIHVARNSIQYRRFADDFPYQERGNLWTDTITGSFTADKLYVVQTNTKVVERCLLLGTDPGDLVLDPTCGSGTTALMAERTGRRWITIDTSRVAMAIARARLMAARHPSYLLLDSQAGAAHEAELAGTEPASGPFNRNVRKGFVYERARRITLGSIARNPAIVKSIGKVKLARTIAQNAEQIRFWDQPAEDPSRVRVTGRFTVESLSPHTPLAPDDTPAPDSAESGFEATVLDNLRTSGVHNTFKGERLAFETLDPHPGRWLQATGRFTDDSGKSRTVAVSIGPRYGTVGPDQVKDAAKEAVEGLGYDLLLVLGFAFDSSVASVAEQVAPSGGFASAAKERKHGRVRVLPVRMNLDLTMGEDVLAKSRTASLFNVFGQPDLEIKTSDEGVVVTLRGLDVYDPKKNEVRTASIDEIACWMIDSDYDGESFFVRHAYFTGADAAKQFAALKRSLQAEIDQEAWESLFTTTSRPFPRPADGRIAVKVINHHGDEVLQVYEVPGQ